MTGEKDGVNNSYGYGGFAGIQHHQSSVDIEAHNAAQVGSLYSPAHGGKIGDEENAPQIEKIFRGVTLLVEDPPVCNICGSTPCYWLVQRQEVLDLTEVFHANHIGNERVPRNEIRKKAYRIYTYERYCFFCEGNSVQTPNCVLEGTGRVCSEELWKVCVVRKRLISYMFKSLLSDYLAVRMFLIEISKAMVS